LIEFSDGKAMRRRGGEKGGTERERERERKRERGRGRGRGVMVPAAITK